MIVHQNMRKIQDIKELQNIELEILKVSTDILEKYSITSFLAGGSLLGAIRHDGFIPWDDDIDVFVPRNDYDRVAKVLISELAKNGNYDVLYPGKEGYPFPFIKVIDKKTVIIDEKLNDEFNNMGLWIDIFPLDHYPDSKFMHAVCFRVLRLFRGVLASKTYKAGIRTGGVVTNGIANSIYGLMGGYQKLCVRIDNFGRWMNHRYYGSDHLACGTYPENMREYHLKSNVMPLIKHKFERYEFCIPKNYHEHLSNYYGNYMELPPEDKRQRHFITSYVIED